MNEQNNSQFLAACKRILTRHKQNCPIRLLFRNETLMFARTTLSNTNSVIKRITRILPRVFPIAIRPKLKIILAAYVTWPAVVAACLPNCNPVSLFSRNFRVSTRSHVHGRTEWSHGVGINFRATRRRASGTVEELPSAVTRRYEYEKGLLCPRCLGHQAKVA